MRFACKSDSLIESFSIAKGFFQARFTELSGICAKANAWIDAKGWELSCYPACP